MKYIVIIHFYFKCSDEVPDDMGTSEIQIIIQLFNHSGIQSSIHLAKSLTPIMH